MYHSDVSLWAIQMNKSDDHGHYPGSKAQVVESLKASDYTQAKVKATIRRATHLAQ